MSTRKVLGRREFLKLSAAATGALALAACSAPPSPSPAATAPAQAKAVTITYWDFIPRDNANDPRSISLGQRLDLFQQKNPDIKVNLEVVAGNIVTPLFLQASTAKRPPDVVRIFEVVPAIKAGALEPLDDYAKNVDKSDWLMDWKDNLFQGQKYALPLEYRFSALMYLKDELTKRNLAVPDTWEKLVDVASKIGPDNPMGYAMGLGAPDIYWIFEWFVSTVWSAGGEVLNSDGKAVFNSPEGVKAFQVIPDLILKNKGSSKACIGWQYNDTTSALQARTAVMTTVGTHRFRAIRTASKDVAEAPFPGFGSGPGKSIINGWTLGMAKGSQNKEAAWKFLDFTMSPESMLLVAKGGEVPSRKSTFNDPWFKTPDADDLNWASTQIQKQGRYIVYPEKTTDLIMSIIEAAQKVLLVDTPVKTALDAAATKYNTLIGMK